MWKKMRQGFLKAEKPAVAAGVDALEQSLEQVLRETEALRLISDPPEEPFRSRYEERSLLDRLLVAADRGRAGGHGLLHRDRVHRRGPQRGLRWAATRSPLRDMSMLGCDPHGRQSRSLFVNTFAAHLAKFAF